MKNFIPTRFLLSKYTLLSPSHVIYLGFSQQSKDIQKTCICSGKCPSNILTFLYFQYRFLKDVMTY